MVFLSTPISWGSQNHPKLQLRLPAINPNLPAPLGEGGYRLALRREKAGPEKVEQ